jgi:hypothetical protein
MFDVILNTVHAGKCNTFSQKKLLYESDRVASPNE